MLDDGTLLIEGPAIAQYISDQVPSKNLAPPYGAIERTKLQSWLNFCSSEMHKGGFSPLFYEGMPEKGKEIFRRRLTARFTYLDPLSKGRGSTVSEHVNRGESSAVCLGSGTSRLLAF